MISPIETCLEAENRRALIINKAATTCNLITMGIYEMNRLLRMQQTYYIKMMMTITAINYRVDVLQFAWRKNDT